MQTETSRPTEANPETAVFVLMDLDNHRDLGPIEAHTTIHKAIQAAQEITDGTHKEPCRFETEADDRWICQLQNHFWQITKLVVQ